MADGPQRTMSKPTIYNKEHQEHYTKFDPQPIEICEMYDLDHHKSSAVAYILRSGYKKDPGLKSMSASETKDIEKAIWFLQRWIQVKGEWEKSKDSNKGKDSE